MYQDKARISYHSHCVKPMKRIDTSKLKKGDIILSTAPEWVSLFVRWGTFSDISHAMLYVANGSVMDSTSDGVHARNIDRLIYHDRCALYVYRPVVALARADVDRVVEYIRSETGAPYSTKEAVAAAFPTPGEGDQNQFCSRLVARAYASVGVYLSSNPNYTSPANIKKSPLLKKVADAVVSAETADVDRVNSVPDATVGMRDSTVFLLDGLRQIAPDIRVLNDAIFHLIKNPQDDAKFAAVYKQSGYLTYWTVEVRQHPWRYDVDAIVHFYHQADEKKKRDILDYCRTTLQDEVDGVFNHWKTNEMQLRDLSSRHPLETLQLLANLYLILCQCHKRRINAAQILLNVYGDRATLT